MLRNRRARLHSKLPRNLCVRRNVTVAFLKTCDVIENFFLSLRSWEHESASSRSRCPLVVERSNRPLRVTKHSRSPSRKRQGFAVINFIGSNNARAFAGKYALMEASEQTSDWYA